MENRWTQPMDWSTLSAPQFFNDSWWFYVQGAPKRCLSWVLLVCNAKDPVISSPGSLDSLVFHAMGHHFLGFFSAFESWRSLSEPVICAYFVRWSSHFNPHLPWVSVDCPISRLNHRFFPHLCCLNHSFFWGNKSSTYFDKVYTHIYIV